MGNRGSSRLLDEEIKIISEETGFSAAQIERLYSRFMSLDKSGICGSLSRQDFLRVPELAINPLCDRIVHMFFVDCDDDHDRINFRQFMKVLAAFRSSSKPTKTRTISRQESIQTIFSSLSQNRYTHLRRSSYNDRFHDIYRHHTTNQHSVHYAASTNHLPSVINSHLFSGGSNQPVGPSWPFKRPIQMPLVDPEEPVNCQKNKLLFMFKIYDVNNDDLIGFDDLVAILSMMLGKYVNDEHINKIAEKTLQAVDKNCDGFIDFKEFRQAFSKIDIDELLKVKFPNS